MGDGVKHKQTDTWWPESFWVTQYHIPNQRDSNPLKYILLQNTYNFMDFFLFHITYILHRFSFFCFSKNNRSPIWVQFCNQYKKVTYVTALMFLWLHGQNYQLLCMINLYFSKLLHWIHFTMILQYYYKKTTALQNPRNERKNIASN